MPNAPSQKLSASTSVVLDVLRILAASIVVIFHASSLWLTAYPAVHDGLSKASHAAVVLFFVISGYVMAFTTAANNRGPRQYAVARLSRLYSVLVLALVVTAIVEVIVVHHDAVLAARYVRDFSWVRYLLTLFFGNESGLVSAAPPLNSPLWSLSYEFWYYTLFGIWVYFKARRGAVWWLVAAGVIAGPKILLLLPVWLFGVGAYRWAKPVFPVALAWLLAGGLLGLGALAVAYLPALPAAVGTKPLFMTGQFVTDWVVGALFALALWVLPGRRVAGASTWVKPLRRVADLSFPLYALHFPLLVLWRAVFDWQANSWPELGLVLVGVCLLAGTIGWLLEKQRGKWIRFFAWASTFIGKKPVASRIRLPD